MMSTKFPCYLIRLGVFHCLLPANLKTGATITNKRPSLVLANLKSISVPPRSAMDTGTYDTRRANMSRSTSYLIGAWDLI